MNPFQNHYNYYNSYEQSDLYKNIYNNQSYSRDNSSDEYFQKQQNLTPQKQQHQPPPRLTTLQKIQHWNQNSFYDSGVQSMSHSSVCFKFFNL